jgi:hypothetical protein
MNGGLTRHSVPKVRVDLSLDDAHDVVRDYDEGGGEMLDILVVTIRHALEVGVTDLVDAMDAEQTS